MIRMDVLKKILVFGLAAFCITFGYLLKSMQEDNKFLDDHVYDLRVKNYKLKAQNSRLNEDVKQEKELIEGAAQNDLQILERLQTQYEQQVAKLSMAKAKVEELQSRKEISRLPTVEEQISSVKMKIVNFENRLVEIREMVAGLDKDSLDSIGKREVLREAFAQTSSQVEAARNELNRLQSELQNSQRAEYDYQQLLKEAELSSQAEQAKVDELNEDFQRKRQEFEILQKRGTASTSEAK